MARYRLVVSISIEKTEFLATSRVAPRFKQKTPPIKPFFGKPPHIDPVFINLVKESDLCLLTNICNNVRRNSEWNNDFEFGDFQFGASREALTEPAL